MGPRLPCVSCLCHLCPWVFVFSSKKMVACYGMMLCKYSDRRHFADAIGTIKNEGDMPQWEGSLGAGGAGSWHFQGTKKFAQKLFEIICQPRTQRKLTNVINDTHFRLNARSRWPKSCAGDRWPTGSWLPWWRVPPLPWILGRGLWEGFLWMAFAGGISMWCWRWQCCGYNQAHASTSILVRHGESDADGLLLNWLRKLNW